jgi:glyoxylase-like metal-dependent hydrolase (beta-lactamase superfamily II)
MSPAAPSRRDDGLLPFVLLTLLGLGCAPAPAASPAKATAAKDTAAHVAPAAAANSDEDEPAPEAQVFRWKGDPRIGTYVSIPWGFSTSSYWIEGPEGLVVIDTQFLPSAAEDLVTRAETMTGKKVAMAIVLHANPDKFNGTAALAARGINVVTSKQVADLIPAVHEKRLKAFYSRYEPDYPKDAPKPGVFGAATTKLSAGGVTLTAHVLGAGCSEAHVAVEFEGNLFVGDLVAAGSHSWLEIGRTDEWLLRIKELRALSPRFVHPGRGPSGGPDLLDHEEAYLRRFIEIVAAEKPSMPPPPGALDRVKTRILDAYPDLAFPVFLGLGVPAEWRRQAEAAAKGPR